MFPNLKFGVLHGTMAAVGLLVVICAAVALVIEIRSVIKDMR